MHLLTRRAFAVQFEWLRLGQLVVVMGGLAAAGDLALPTSGRGRPPEPRARWRRRSRWCCWPPASLHPAELRQARALLRGVRRAYPRPAGSEP